MLLELGNTALEVDAVDVLGVVVVGRGFVGPRGRLVLYHCSASGCVLNFLNLAPGKPWTCDWVSSLQTYTIQPVPKYLAPHGDLKSRSQAIHLSNAT